MKLWDGMKRRAAIVEYALVIGAVVLAVLLGVEVGSPDGWIVP